METTTHKTILVDAELLRRWRLACLLAVGRKSNADFPASLSAAWSNEYDNYVPPTILPSSGKVTSVRIRVPVTQYNPPGAHSATSYLEGLLIRPVRPIAKEFPRRLGLKLPRETVEALGRVGSWCQDNYIFRKDFLLGTVAMAWARRDDWALVVGPEEHRTESVLPETWWTLKALSLTTGIAMKRIFAMGVALERDTWEDMSPTAQEYVDVTRGHLEDFYRKLEASAKEGTYRV